MVGGLKLQGFSGVEGLGSLRVKDFSAQGVEGSKALNGLGYGRLMVSWV